MTHTFSDKESRLLFAGRSPQRFSGIQRRAERRLNILDQASSLQDLAGPPSNRLEALVGDRAGQYSIRINDRWRICFEWRDDGAYEVEIVDDH